MRNRKFEEYLLDDKWKLRNDIPEYKILSIPLKDNLYYYAFSGLLENSAVLVPSSKKCSGGKISVLFSSKDYSVAKYFFLCLVCSDILNSENVSDEQTNIKICNIFKALK